MSKHFCFTFNNYPEGSGDTIEDLCKEIANEWAFQEEIAPKTGTPHIQGYIHFKQRVNPIHLIYTGLIHWEKCKNIAASRNYCKKSNTRKEGGKQWEHLIEMQRVGRPKKETSNKIIETIKVINELYEWQKEICEMIKKEPESRKIYWYWEPDGGAGKTEFQRYLVVKHDAIVVSGKAHDIKCGIARWVQEKKSYPKLVIINIPKSLDEKCISYQAMEDVKDALFFSGKYESGMIVGNPPHLLIFANIEPQYGRLSKDRLIVKSLPPAAPSAGEMLHRSAERPPH